ncbi:hypothetical protein IWQ49_004437 [Labrenzia sp. EL_126]|nr:hypothetical protein [Labrenzia sp. EL_126]
MSKATENAEFLEELGDLLERHGYAAEIQTQNFPAAMMVADYLDAMRKCANTMREELDLALSKYNN